MSFWTRNSDLLDQVTTDALPSPYKEKVESGEMDIYDVPEKVLFQAMEDGIADYWAGMADRGEP